MWGDRLAVENSAAGPPGPAGAPGPAGVPYLQATADSAFSSGQVAKAVTGGHITLCSGSASGDGDQIRGIVHPGVMSGALANFYPDGSVAPVAGLPSGPVFRLASGGLAVWASVPAGAYTQQIGISDGTGVQVRIGAEVQR